MRDTTRDWQRWRVTAAAGTTGPLAPRYVRPALAPTALGALDKAAANVALGNQIPLAEPLRFLLARRHLAAKDEAAARKQAA